MSSKSNDFRYDIEGLRGIAILAVFFFHFNWSFFSGGFVGVDVFFVISGYLITRHIVDEMKDGSFSFATFYMRRARRLFPALFFTIAITMVVAMFLFPPAGLEGVARSVIVSLVSLSNIYFWKQSGYFDGDAVEKPLLHTWSLSVEEQFYIFWPLLLLLLIRFSKTTLQGSTTLLAVCVMGFVATEMYLAIDAQGSFFLTPFRLGEFTIGALCAWLPPLGPRFSRHFRDAVSLTGVALIFFSVIYFSESTSFPGFSAVIPCLGTALAIYAGPGVVSGLLLGNRAITSVGRISYSLYLAHWPVYTLFWQWNGAKPGLLETLILIVVTFVIAIAMNRYVENRFRVGTSANILCRSTRSFIATFSILSALIIIFSIIVWKTDVVAWLYSDDVRSVVANAEEEKAKRFALYAKMKGKLDTSHRITDSKRIMIIGDSHAVDMFNALVPTYPDYEYEFYGVPGCPPLVREDYSVLSAKHPNRSKCIQRNENILYKHDLAKEDLIVINTLFGWYTTEMLTRAVEQIGKRSRAKIVVLGNYLVFDVDFPNLVFRHGELTLDQFYQGKLGKRTFAREKELKEISSKIGITYISKKDLFCEGGAIENCQIVFGDKLYTYDSHHLSTPASRRLGALLREQYDTIFGLHP